MMRMLDGALEASEKAEIALGSSFKAMSVKDKEGSTVRRGFRREGVTRPHIPVPAPAEPLLYSRRPLRSVLRGRAVAGATSSS